MPLASIILPCYNAERTIAPCIDSIKQQYLEDFECIIINDGSTDNSLKTINDHIDDRFTIINTTQNSGIVNALNTGIAQSNSDIIIRMDADDTMYPERLKQQVDYLLDHAEVDVVSCLVKTNKEIAKGYRLHVEWINSLTTPNDLWLHRFMDSPFSHPTMAMRKKTFYHYGFYRKGDFPEDYELWLRWFHQDVTFHKLPAHLLQWNDHPQRLSRVAHYCRKEAFILAKCHYFKKEWHQHRNRPLWIWGTGPNAKLVKKTLTLFQVKTEGFIDVKKGKKNTIHYTTINELQNAFILVCIGDRKGKIAAEQYLKEKGLSAFSDYYMFI